MVSQRLCESVPTLRDRTLYKIVWDAFAAGRERFGGRLIHFSVQSNHIHLIVEAENEKALARFMAGLKIRIARGLNRFLGRTGRVFSDRYHDRILRTPTQVRNAINYVLNNDLHHKARRRPEPFDVFSSAPFFDGWAEGRVHWPKPLVWPTPIVAARSWLLTQGWHRAGPISLSNRLSQE